jgi:Helix-turn-helix domain
MGEIERFVDACEAAEFLCLQRRRVLEMAGVGDIPAHPIGSGKRKTWRFRLSELEETIRAQQPVSLKPRQAIQGMIDDGSSRQPNRRN